jgi:hypothetical protein
MWINLAVVLLKHVDPPEQGLVARVAGVAPGRVPGYLHPYRLHTASLLAAGMSATGGCGSSFT